MRRRTGRWILLITTLAAVAVFWQLHRGRTVTNGKQPVLITDVYIWQRDWSPAVRDAVRQQSPRFHRAVILAAEISWPTPDGRVVEVKPDFSAATTGGPIGIAVRIGPLPASISPGPTQEKLIVSTVARAIAAATSAGAPPAEVQLDYDCAESKLPGYVAWVSSVKSVVAPIPVVITALPAWLNRPAFSDLARCSDGFVIQVHSLHTPTGPDDPMAICDPAEARRAVVAASKIGAPFRIALPTYGYTVAFKPDRTFLALSAEGPAPQWPDGTILRQMRADPTAIAGLVREWTIAPPPHCTGIIWYRMPVPGDTINWPAETLSDVMTGQTPAADLHAEIVRTEPKLRDIFLTNTGNTDAVFTGSVTATIDGRQDLIAEALGQFTKLEEPTGGVTFKIIAADGIRIPPGGRLPVGWIRLDSDTEVRTHVNLSP